MGRSIPGALGRLGIRGIDSIVRRVLDVGPFTDRPECVLRIEAARCRSPVLLPDGITVRHGDPILQLHLWNERIERLQVAGIARGLVLLGAFEFSLRLLSRHLQDLPKGDRPVALRGEFGFVTRLRPARVILERLGFAMAMRERPGLRFWRRAFWDNVFSFLLLWTFSPEPVRGKSLIRLQRIEAWMSTEDLLRRYPPYTEGDPSADGRTGG